MKVVLALALGLVAGCGGNVEGPADGSDTGTIAEASSDTAFVDGVAEVADGDATTPGVPLDAVCEVIADAACTSSTKACCTSASISFDEAKCRAYHRADCGKAVENVKAGRAAYDGKAVETCVAAWKSIYTQCKATTLDVYRHAVACAGIFNGTTKVGDACDHASQCSHVGDAAPVCNSSKKCAAVGVADAGGEACRTNGMLCSDGLYCTFPENTCKAATPIGGACSGSMDQSCGFGRYCSSMKCVEGLPPGSGCSDWIQCSSWQCVAGKCSEPAQPVANTTVCGG